MPPISLTQVAPGPSALSPDQFVDDRAVAALLGLSRSYMRQLRVHGGGPRYSKLGGAVRYRVADAISWAQSKSVSSTSEPQAA